MASELGSESNDNEDLTIAYSALFSPSFDSIFPDSGDPMANQFLSLDIETLCPKDPRGVSCQKALGGSYAES